MQNTLNPKSEDEWLRARTKDITSTEVSALFGISPYCTLFELWYQKKSGEVPEFEENERMKWGTCLQDAIAEGIAQEQGWTIRRMDEYIREEDLRIGASFDFKATRITKTPKLEQISENSYSQLPKEYESFILEIKNVDGLQFKQGWVKDDAGNLEAPLHIEIQVQQQLLVSGYSYAYIGALVGGNDLKLLKRKRNENIINGIKAKVAAFWQTIDANIPPEPNFDTDSEFISGLYGYAEPGKYMESDAEIEQLATVYKEYAELEKQGSKGKKEMKAKILTKIGDVEKVGGLDFTISAGTIGPCEVAYTRKGYRDFRINWRKK